MVETGVHGCYLKLCHLLSVDKLPIFTHHAKCSKIDRVNCDSYGVRFRLYGGAVF